MKLKQRRSERDTRDTDNDRPRSRKLMHTQNCFSRPVTLLRRCEDVRVAQIAKERERGTGGRERERMSCRATGKALVASLVVCLGRHPATLAHIHHPLLHSFARACTTAREILHHPSAVSSRSLSLFLCFSFSLASSLSLSLLRPLTPSPRGKGRRNASKNPSN